MKIAVYASLGMTALALLAPTSVGLALVQQERKENDQPSCFHTVNIDWGETIRKADREQVFVNALIKTGLMIVQEGGILIDVDHFEYSSFTVARSGECADFSETMDKKINYAFEHSQGPYGYANQVSEIHFEVTKSSQHPFMERLSALSYESNLKENFIMITGHDELSKCTVRLSFPIEDAQIQVGGYDIEKSLVYHSNYLSYTLSFFRFPFLISIPYSHKIGDSAESDQFDYYYILYHDKCARRIEMTRIMMRWSQLLVGVPFEIDGVEVTGKVSEEEIKQVFGHL